MKMKHDTFMKIAASLGVSTFLLTGCGSEEEDNTTVEMENTTQSTNISQNNCISENKNDPCSDAPVGPVKQQEQYSNPDSSSLLIPFAAGAAGLFLAQSWKRNTLFPNQSTYTPPMTQFPPQKSGANLTPTRNGNIHTQSPPINGSSGIGNNQEESSGS